jgi:hypothetical protein
VTCNFCGAIVLGGFETCGAMFHAVLEREYSDPAYGEAHLFTVDAHALQHSEEHGPRSNAFHLIRLCWLVDHGGDPAIGHVLRGGRASHDAHVESYRHFPNLEPPAFRGEVTVAAVVVAATPKEHAERARAWGQSVWEAWSAHHAWAREQVKLWFVQE